MLVVRQLDPAKRLQYHKTIEPRFQQIVPKTFTRSNPTREAVDDCNVYMQKDLKHNRLHLPLSILVQEQQDRRWPVATMWAGSPMHFKDVMSIQRGEDSDIKCRSADRYGFFGNGITQREVNEADLAYYMKV